MKAAMRAVKNSVMNYDDAEVRVREATSNDSWGAASQLMLQIAEDTNHRYRYKSTLDMLNKRLTDYQHLNHVLKALIVIEFLLRHGDMRFVQDMQDRKVVIRRLRGYKYYKDNKEIGSNVRKWAHKVLGLLENPEELKKEREIAQKTKGKITGFSNEASPREHRQFEPEYKPEFKPDFQPEYKPEESPSPNPKKKDKEEEEDGEENEQEDKPKKKKTKKGKKGGPKKSTDGEPAKKDKENGDNEEEETFDPDAFEAKDKDKDKKKSGKGTTKKKPKKVETSEEEEEEEEAPADNDGGAFQFDAGAEADDFAFGFEDDPKNAKALAQKGGKSKAEMAADPDDFLFAIAAAAPAKQAAPAALPSVSDDTDALFDSGAPAPKAAPASGPEDGGNIWDDLTNVTNLKDDPKQKKKPGAKKPGKTLNEIGGGSELVAFDLGAAATGNPSNALIPSGGPAPYDPMNPFAAPAANPYANPWGQPPMANNPYAANPFAAPAANPFVANPYAPNPYAANPYGAPAAAVNPFGAPAPVAANPFGVPPAAGPAAAANPFGGPVPAQGSTNPQTAKKADPFADFSW